MQSSVPPAPVQLDVSSALKLTKNEGMFKERSLMARNDVWHRVRILHGAKYDKEYILKAILTAAEPADLIPVRYQSSGGDDTSFIARNCGPALEKLCKNNLIIKIPNNDPLILVITLAFASIQDLKVSIQPLLLASLTKRYNSNNKSLVLNNFHREENIAKHVFCPLSQMRTFSHLLRLTKSALITIEHLNLQHNELASLSALESTNLTSIKSLDLRNNNLMGMETLTPIRSLTITELWLDGNPLCENYSSPKQYIESAQKYCPHLIKLDGVLLSSQDIPASVYNFFPNSLSEKLVKQFAKHFFTIYDQLDRVMLKGLYHQDAVYSLCLDGDSISSSHKNFYAYMVENRNILNQDFAKSNSLLYLGPDEIVEALNRLPRCLHNQNSFTYDVMFNHQNTLVFIINGILQFSNTCQQVLSFQRTFILTAQPNHQYKIINDQYHIDGTIAQVTSCFNFEKQISPNNYQITNLNANEKNEIAVMLTKITTMTDKWAWKFLEDVNWDFKRAVLNFMHAYSSARLPTEAFR